MESEIPIETVMQDVMLFVWSKHFIVEQPLPKLYESEMFAKLMKNLKNSVCIEAYRWNFFNNCSFQNFYEYFLSPLKLFANYVAYICYILNESPDAYECFYDILSMVTYISLDLAFKGRFVYINACKYLFCAFFETELRAKFESRGGWKKFNEYLERQFNCLVSADEWSNVLYPMQLLNYFEFYRLKGMWGDRTIIKGQMVLHKRQREPYYILNGIVLKDITRSDVECHENAASFAELIWEKINELLQQDFREIPKPLLRSSDVVDDHYGGTVAATSQFRKHIVTQFPLQTRPKAILKSAKSIEPCHEEQIKQVFGVNVSKDNQYHSQEVQKASDTLTKTEDNAVSKKRKEVFCIRSYRGFAFIGDSEETVSRVYTKHRIIIEKGVTTVQTHDMEIFDELIFPEENLDSKSTMVEIHETLPDNALKPTSKASEITQPDNEQISDVKVQEESICSLRNAQNSFDETSYEEKDSTSQCDKKSSHDTSYESKDSDSQCDQKALDATSCEAKESSSQQVQEALSVMRNLTEDSALNKDKEPFRGNLKKPKKTSWRPIELSFHCPKFRNKREPNPTSASLKAHNLNTSNKQISPVRASYIQSKSTVEKAKNLPDNAPESISKTPETIKLNDAKLKIQTSDEKICKEKTSSQTVKKTPGVTSCETNKPSSKHAQESSDVKANLTEHSTLQEDEIKICSSSNELKNSSSGESTEWSMPYPNYKKRLMKKRLITSAPLKSHNLETANKQIPLVQASGVESKLITVEKVTTFFDDMSASISKECENVQPCNEEKAYDEKVFDEVSPNVRQTPDVTYEARESYQHIQEASDERANLTEYSDFQKDRDIFLGGSNEKKSSSEESEEKWTLISGKRQKQFQKRGSVTASDRLQARKVKITTKDIPKFRSIFQKPVLTKHEKGENTSDNPFKAASKISEIVQPHSEHQTGQFSPKEKQYSPRGNKSPGVSSNLAGQSTLQKNTETFPRKKNEKGSPRENKSPGVLSNVSGQSALQKNPETFPRKKNEQCSPRENKKSPSLLSIKAGQSTLQKNPETFPRKKNEKSPGVSSNVAGQSSLQKYRQDVPRKKNELKDSSTTQITSIKKKLFEIDEVPSNIQNSKTINKQDVPPIREVPLEPKLTEKDKNVSNKKSADASKPTVAITRPCEEQKEKVKVYEEEKQSSQNIQKTSGLAASKKQQSSKMVKKLPCLKVNLEHQSILQKDREAFYKRDKDFLSENVNEQKDQVSEMKVYEELKSQDMQKASNVAVYEEKLSSKRVQKSPELMANIEKLSSSQKYQKVFYKKDEEPKESSPEKVKEQISDPKASEMEQPSSETIEKVSSLITCEGKQSSSKNVQKSPTGMTNVIEQSALEKDREAAYRKDDEPKESLPEIVYKQKEQVSIGNICRKQKSQDVQKASGGFAGEELQSSKIFQKSPDLMLSPTNESALEKDQEAFHEKKDESKEYSSEEGEESETISTNIKVKDLSKEIVGTTDSETSNKKDVPPAKPLHLKLKSTREEELKEALDSISESFSRLSDFVKSLCEEYEVESS